ncbi:tRNA (adenosine(37)-N6)-threonylcarbamoyltransferase complex dimerization subunit type 1 TsaB [Sandaracinobacteroides saxicola]|uniref:tRNA (Adenosine(37)-N6)-threonylcarbamoyltransferase complex dimerization subunit type 1 TsaB n=1 Tax=Sandaracinobacteroides saxicola TaxID=2759707 RepID=A0A7G5ILZ9_9SPHN|nr:tRNA (adenosine(37)-N6)-threonylcarbamoyltransferase complex dimerization subunit type 1 TsaB [Sandaracinobacteroides saxicola]QMW24391.1 tRNA (adenosine(37)-N6)-threonylcarbamoyltransferase complex dimerization subunit type 1 TsaB [Sandaracinobacteroides saxicola]
MPDRLTSQPVLVVATGHTLSLALIAGAELLAAHDDPAPRGQADALLPAVRAMLGGQRPARIVVETGPGSFTGLRIGIAAARALGLAWGVPVAGVSSSLLTAAPFLRDADTPLWVALAAPRGQVWLEPIGRPDGRSLADPVALRPGMPHAVAADAALVGTGLLPGVATRLAGDPPCASNARFLTGCLGDPIARYVRPADHVGA